MKMENRFLHTFIAVIMLIGMLSISCYAAEDSDHTVNPDKIMTRAEFIIMVNDAFGYKDMSPITFADVHTDDGYYDEIAIAVEAGYIQGYENGTLRPNNGISRQEAAMIFANIMKLEMAEDSLKIDTLIDNKEIPAWSRGAIGAVLDKGYMAGHTDRTFKPEDPITRAEATATLHRAAGTVYDLPGTYGDATVAGNVTVSSTDVNLKNLSIKGDLYLTEGIGNGTVSLDNVIVEGRTLICGGGTESIIVKNSTLGPTVVQKKDGKIRLEASGKTKIGKMELRSGGKLEENDLTEAGFGDIEVKLKDPSEGLIQLKGDFNKVDILTALKLELLKGKIEELKMGETAGGSTIDVLKGGKIESINNEAGIEAKILYPPAPRRSAPETTDAAAPVIGTDLTDQTTTLGTSVTLDATATVTDGGTVSYQWYSNTTPSAIGGTAMSGKVSATYTDSVDIAGIYYYYCIVTNTNPAATGAQTATTASAVATITVN